MRSVPVWLGVGAVLAGAVQAQSQTEPSRAGARDVLPVASEVALARSAAPAAVSASARVLVWDGTDFRIAEEGTNGVTCYVARSWPASLEPHCFDEEGSRTILQVHLLETKLRHQGKTEAEIDAAIAAGLRTGSLRLPARPAMSYMMSAGQQLISDDGRPVGAWRPHLMIYYPYLTQQSLGLGATPSIDAAMVDGADTPFSNIMIVVRDFVPVAGDSATRR